jgi:hypothetical protein
MANEWKSAPTARRLPEFNTVHEGSPRDRVTNAGDVPRAGSVPRQRGVRGRRRRRRGAILALFVILCVVLLGLLALTVDVGLIQTSRREAQVAADSAALAAAAYVPSSTTDATAAAVEFAGYNKIADTPIVAASVDVEFGTWAPSQGVFTPALSPGNAVKVTVRRDATHAGPVPLYFGRIFNKTGFDVSKSAIAMTTPRDIIFAVDVSPSMNNDGEPTWATWIINGTYTDVGRQIGQRLYDDLGFQTTFPGTTQHLGSNLVTDNDWNYAVLTDNGGPLYNLTNTTANASYRILVGDSEATRKTKAYRWIIDKQLATLMPNAIPAPNSANSASFEFWSIYLDYMCLSQYVTKTSLGGTSKPGIALRPLLSPNNQPMVLPPSKRVTYFADLNTYGNPFATFNTSQWTNRVSSYKNKLGYETYLQFILDFGMDEIIKLTGIRSQLSTLNANCSRHTETIDGVAFTNVPASEQPMHAIRRALISTINLIKSRNQNVGDSNQRDRIGLLRIDSNERTAADVVLTTNYDSVRASCVTLQAMSELFTGETASQLDANLTFAAQQLMPSAQGRTYSRKIVIVLSDFYPTTTSYTQTQIDSYQLLFPPPEYGWFHAVAPPAGTTDSRYEPSTTKRRNQNGALMAAHQGYGAGVEIYPVKVGFSSSQTMMDALAEFGGTAYQSDVGPTITNNPALYESRIKAVLADIIDNPRGRLVQ